jgi:hypothetical protein
LSSLSQNGSHGGIERQNPGSETVCQAEGNSPCASKDYRLIKSLLVFLIIHRLLLQAVASEFIEVKQLTWYSVIYCYGSQEGRCDLRTDDTAVASYKSS